MRGLLLGRLLDRTGQIDVAEDRADDATGGRIRIDRREQRTFARQALGDRSAGGDGEDRAVAARGCGERLVPVFVDHRIGERTESGDEGSLEALRRPNEILQGTRRTVPVRLQEARPGRLLDVTSARLQELEARLLTSLDVFEFLDLLGRLAPLGFQLRTTFREWRGLAVEALDVCLDLLPLRVEAFASLAGHAQLRFEPVVLPFTGRDRSLQRFHLHPAPRGLLPGPPTELVHLTPVLIGGSERAFRVVELPLAVGELFHGPLQIRLDPRELRLDRVEPSRAARLGRELLSRSCLTIEGAPERVVCLGPVGLRGAESELALREVPGGGRPRVRTREHVGVERVQPGACFLPLAHALVPAALPAVALREQAPEACRGELPGELLGLLGQRLVLLGHLGLLAQWLQLSLELGHHVLEPEQILVQAGQLALGALLPTAVLGDAGRLLDVLPTLLGPGEEHFLELTLPDDRVQRPPDPRLRQQLLHVEQPDQLAVDPVLTLPGAEDRAADLDLGHGDRDQTGLVVDHQLDLGHPEGGTAGSPREDDVGHLPASERTWTLLAQRPADRIDQIRLAGAVGAHDHTDAGDELEDGLVREGLEPADLDLSQEHATRC